jgi:enoyl-CoA hydratase/carnithine racemase
MSDLILVQRDGPIATVVFNRPDKLNAFTRAMWQRLGEVVRELSGQHELHCVVLRGAGDRAFSPGNDIGEFATERSNREQARAYGAVMAETVAAFDGCRHPLVAMIQGICVGGGLEIAALCDIRICGESSRFGVPIKRLGLVMSPLEVRALVELVGKAVALEILLEGRVFGASEALHKGLVNRVVADDKVQEEAWATATRIAEGAPLVARWHKRFIARMHDPAPLSAEEIDEGYDCYESEDYQIGYRSFLAKTRPEFKGR